MITRRDFVGFALAAGGLLAARPISAQNPIAPPEMGDDGLYIQPWFINTFLDFREDLIDAKRNGKRFAVVWEQKGCSACKRLHLVNFRVPEVRDFVRDNFDLLQLNVRGSREVTDFDGMVLGERQLARRYRVVYTPTIQFFPDGLDQFKGRGGKDLEVARMPGYLPPAAFLTMFRFVREKAYERLRFQEYIDRTSI